MKLTNQIVSVIKNAAKKLTGPKRRLFMANATQELLNGSPRKAERELGWGRGTVEKGLKELDTGLTCIDNYKARGNKKTEEKLPNLEKDIQEIVEPYSQADPRFHNTFSYTRITAKAVRQLLIEKKNYKDENLPANRTISNILNRLNYRLKRVQKTKPVKKIPEVDEIFKNVHQANQESDKNPHSLRISIDSKAKVKIGPFSRDGKARGKEAEKASDHDFASPKDQLVPLGILDVIAGSLTIIFGQSPETTDLIVDALHQWWDKNKHRYSHIREIVINLDNGPHIQSHRTQFIKRIVEFADYTGLRIHLVYYPPYHSKYNSIEHCWGVLESHWNGTVLDTINKALEWAKTMTWKGLTPVVHFIEKIYEKGVRLTKRELKNYLEQFERSEKLPKWDVVIEPRAG